MKFLASGNWLHALRALGCTVVFAAGCASAPPPTEQMAVSNSAIANAMSTGPDLRGR